VTKSKKQKPIFYITNIIVLISFLSSNIILARDLSADKDTLAPVTNLPAVLSDAVPDMIAMEVLRTLDGRGSAEGREIKAFYDRYVEERIRESDGYKRCFALKASEDSPEKGWSLYIIDLKKYEITRYSTSENSRDLFYDTLSSVDAVKVNEKNNFQPNGKKYFREKILFTAKHLQFISACLDAVSVFPVKDISSDGKIKQEEYKDWVLKQFRENAGIFNMQPAPKQRITVYQDESANPFITVMVHLGNINLNDITVEMRYGKENTENSGSWEYVRDVRMSYYQTIDNVEGVYLFKGNIPTHELGVGVYRFTTRVMLERYRYADSRQKYCKWNNSRGDDGVLIVKARRDYEKKILGLYPERITGTIKHAQRVSRLAEIIAQEIVWKVEDENEGRAEHLASFIYDVSISGLAHDVGKGSSDKMMDAVEDAGGYNPLLDTHGSAGVEILKRAGINSSVIEQVTEHHHDPRVISDPYIKLIAEVIYAADIIDSVEDPTRRYRKGEMLPTEEIIKEMRKKRDLGFISNNVFIAIEGLLKEGRRNFMDIIYESRAGLSWTARRISSKRHGKEAVTKKPNAMESSPMIKTPVKGVKYYSDKIEVNGVELTDAKTEVARAEKAVSLYKTDSSKYKVQKLEMNGVQDEYRVIELNGKYFVVREVLLKGFGYNEEEFLAMLSRALAKEAKVQENEVVRSALISNPSLSFSFESLPEVVLVDEMTASPYLGANCTGDGWIGVNKILYSVVGPGIRDAELERLFIHELWHEMNPGTDPVLVESFLQTHDEVLLKMILTDLRNEIEPTTYKVMLHKILDRYAKANTWIWDFIKDDYKKQSEVYGGKGVGLIDLVRLNGAIKEMTGVDIEIPRFEILSIPEGWDEILLHNKDLVREGNFINSHRSEVKSALKEARLDKYPQLQILKKYIERNPITGDLDRYLSVFMEHLADSIQFPKRLPINPKLASLYDISIERSSGEQEDQFDRSFAGVFPSYVATDRLDALFNVILIYQTVIKQLWVEDKSMLDDNGMAVVLQNMVEADKGGIALSDGQGRISIEAVVGRPSTAVKQEKPNSTIYDCTVKGSSLDFKIVQCFSKYPYEIETAEGKFSRKDNKAKIKELWEKGTVKVRGFNSPLTEEEVQKIVRVVKAIEDLLGYPVDIEFAIKDGKIILLQKRPRVDVKLEEIQPLSEKVDPATVSIAAGKQYRAVRAVPVVVFNKNIPIDPKDIEMLEDFYGENGYIKVETDIISEEHHRPKDNPEGQKILMDPDSGSRNAHNMQLFRDKKGNDFVYLAGPNLKPWLRKLTFHQLGNETGILMSDELVMVESNGDGEYAGMYIKGEDDALTDSQPDIIYGMKKVVDYYEDPKAVVEKYSLIFDKICNMLSRSYKRFTFMRAPEKMDGTFVMEAKLKKVFMDLVDLQEICDKSANRLSEKEIVEQLVEIYLSGDESTIERIKEKTLGAIWLLGFKSLWPSGEDNAGVRMLEILAFINELCTWILDRPALTIRNLERLETQREEKLKDSAEDLKLRGSFQRAKSLAERFKKYRAETDKKKKDEFTENQGKLRVVFIDDEFVDGNGRSFADGLFTSIKNSDVAGKLSLKGFSRVDKAREYIKRERPQVIFVDYDLGTMFADGFVMGLIEEMPDYTPDIYMVSAVEGYYEDRLADDGFAGLVPKGGVPFSSSIVLKHIGAALVKYAGELTKEEPVVAPPAAQADSVKIVFIDDDKNRYDSCKQLIMGQYGSLGVKAAESFASPEDGLEYIRREMPQVIFVDYSLGKGWDGIRVIEEIRKIQGYNPWIYMKTGFELDAAKRQKLDALGVRKVFDVLSFRDGVDPVLKEFFAQRSAEVNPVAVAEEARVQEPEPAAKVTKESEIEIVIIDDEYIDWTTDKKYTTEEAAAKKSDINRIILAVKEAFAKSGEQNILDRIKIKGFKSEREALVYIRENRPKLLFVDMVLEGSDSGLEVGLQILEEIPDYEPEMWLLTGGGYVGASNFGYKGEILKELSVGQILDIIRENAATQMPVEAQPKEQKPLKVLIVDDGYMDPSEVFVMPGEDFDTVMRRQIFITGDVYKVQKRFVGQDVVVKGIADPEEALRYIEEEKPDIIITDLDMGNYSGTELAYDLRERFPDYKPKVYLMTGGNPIFDDSRFFEDQFDSNRAEYAIASIIEKALAKRVKEAEEIKPIAKPMPSVASAEESVLPITEGRLKVLFIDDAFGISSEAVTTNVERLIDNSDSSKVLLEGMGDAEVQGRPNLYVEYVKRERPHVLFIDYDLGNISAVELLDMIYMAMPDYKPVVYVMSGALPDNMDALTSRKVKSVINKSYKGLKNSVDQELTEYEKQKQKTKPVAAQTKEPIFRAVIINDEDDNLETYLGEFESICDSEDCKHDILAQKNLKGVKEWILVNRPQIIVCDHYLGLGVFGAEFLEDIAKVIQTQCPGYSPEMILLTGATDTSRFDALSALGVKVLIPGKDFKVLSRYVEGLVANVQNRVLRPVYKAMIVGEDNELNGPLYVSIIQNIRDGAKPDIFIGQRASDAKIDILKEQPALILVDNELYSGGMSFLLGLIPEIRKIAGYNPTIILMAKNIDAQFDKLTAMGVIVMNRTNLDLDRIKGVIASEIARLKKLQEPAQTPKEGIAEDAVFRALVLDDAKDQREYLCGQLDSRCKVYGYKLDAFGREDKEAIKDWVIKNKPPLIIIDQKLETMRGDIFLRDELLSVIQSIPDYKPEIYLLTGAWDLHDIQYLEGLGVKIIDRDMDSNYVAIFASRADALLRTMPQSKKGVPEVKVQEGQAILRAIIVDNYSAIGEPAEYAIQELATEKGCAVDVCLKNDFKDVLEWILINRPQLIVVEEWIEDMYRNKKSGDAFINDLKKLLETLPQYKGYSPKIILLAEREDEYAYLNRGLERIIKSEGAVGELTEKAGKVMDDIIAQEKRIADLKQAKPKGPETVVRVLVVDDEVNERNAMGKALSRFIAGTCDDKKCDSEIIFRQSTKGFIDLVLEKRPQVIILDHWIRGDEVSGSELAQILYENLSHIPDYKPIVFLASNNPEMVGRDSVKDLGVKIINKGYMIDELHKILGGIIDVVIKAKDSIGPAAVAVAPEEPVDVVSFAPLKVAFIDDELEYDDTKISKLLSRTKGDFPAAEVAITGIKDMFSARIIEYLKKERPEVIFIDFVLGFGGNAFKFLEKMFEEIPDYKPVIYLLTGGGYIDEGECFVRGISDIIIKEDYDYQKIKNAIQGALDKRKTQSATLAEPLKDTTGERVPPDRSSGVAESIRGPGFTADEMTDDELDEDLAVESDKAFKLVIIGDKQDQIELMEDVIWRVCDDNGFSHDTFDFETISGARDYILSIRPHLIVIDSDMLGSNGYDSLRELLEELDYSPTILLIKDETETGSLDDLKDLGVTIIEKEEDLYSRIETEMAIFKSFAMGIDRADTQKALPKPEPVKVSSVQPQAKPKIVALMIDDDRRSNDVWSRQLESTIEENGCDSEVKTSESTDGMIEWILENRPQLITIDQSLRGERGDKFIEGLVERLKKDSPGYIPAIALITGSDDINKLRSLESLGVVVIGKGFYEQTVGFFEKVITDVKSKQAKIVLPEIKPTTEKTVDILIVDDEIKAIEGMEKLLAGLLGVDISRVSIHRETTSKGALEYLRTHKPQIAILDKRIDSGYTGIDLIKMIASESIPTHAYLVTQYLDETSEAFMQAQGIMYASKTPSDVKGLMQDVANKVRNLLKIKVLIVDDSQRIRDSLTKDLIGRIGAGAVDITAVSNVDDALHELRRFQPDFLLLDMALSGNGHGRKILENMPKGKTPTVIVISQMEEPLSPEIAQALGVNEILSKPIEGERLDRLVGLIAPKPQAEHHPLEKGAVPFNFIGSITFDVEGKNVRTEVKEKSDLYRQEYIEDALRELVAKYGTGILSGLKKIDIVDRTGPVGSQIDHKAEIDIDVFRDRNMVLDVLEHEAIHEILGMIIPDNAYLAEVVATWYSLKRFAGLSQSDRENIIEILEDKSNGLDPRGKYVEMLKYISANKLSEDDLIGLAVSYLEYKGFSVDQVKATEHSFEAFLGLLNDLSQAHIQDVKRKVYETEKKMLKVVKAIGGIRIEGNVAENIRKTIGYIAGNENWSLPKSNEQSRTRYVVVNKERIADKLDKDEFKAVMAEFQEGNIKVVYDLNEIPKDQKVDMMRDVIILVDPEDVKDWEGKHRLRYLPLPYMGLSLRLAGHLVLIGDDIRPGTPVYNFVKGFYEKLLDKKLSDAFVTDLFVRPWYVLPKSKKFTEDLSILRSAIDQLSVAA
jgi:CheY-like chemotaxis protein/HD-GYP domain-containing protein (c-di-GMP phosphodiesterase class II)